MRASTASLLAALAMTAGCALMTPADVEMRKQVIAKVPADVPKAQAHPAVLLVLEPEAQAIYDTTQMAYATKPFQLEYFGRNEWADKPARMIHGLLVQTLRNTGYFKEVLMPGQATAHKLALRSELLEIKQDFTADAPTLRLAMRFQLVDAASSKVVATRELSATEPMKEKSPYAGVVAANEAVARLLRDAARFVLDSAG
jgi:cholesterol transport system auxiliary component